MHEKHTLGQMDWRPHANQIASNLASRSRLRPFIDMYGANNYNCMFDSASLYSFVRVIANSPQASRVVFLYLRVGFSAALFCDLYSESNENTITWINLDFIIIHG